MDQEEASRLKHQITADSRPADRSAALLAILLERRTRAQVQKLLDQHEGVSADREQAIAGEFLPGLSPGKRRLLELHARRLLRDCASQQVTLLSRDGAGFPARLRAIPDSPLVIYVKGSAAAFEQPAVAIVGARRASGYGLEMASGLAAALASRGVTVVSGLALGVDGAAHRGALDAGGKTIAVLGSGLARVQPLTHLGLAGRILDSSGLLLSEYPLYRSAAAWHFPERNRIISGLCLGVVVIEATVKSGSLITARLALEQGREVMAVPGAPGLPASGGVNRLLKEGAALIETPDDVVAALGLHLDALPENLTAAGLGPAVEVSAAAGEILARLGAEPVDLDHAVCDAVSNTAEWNGGSDGAGTCGICRASSRRVYSAASNFLNCVVGGDDEFRCHSDGIG